jgi:hypothetical protein
MKSNEERREKINGEKDEEEKEELKRKGDKEKR